MISIHYCVAEKKWTVYIVTTTHIMEARIFLRTLQYLNIPITEPVIVSRPPKMILFQTAGSRAFTPAPCSVLTTLISPASSGLLLFFPVRGLPAVPLPSPHFWFSEEPCSKSLRSGSPAPPEICRKWWSPTPGM